MASVAANTSKAVRCFMVRVNLSAAVLAASLAYQPARVVGREFMAGRIGGVAAGAGHRLGRSRGSRQRPHGPVFSDTYGEVRMVNRRRVNTGCITEEQHGNC